MLEQSNAGLPRGGERSDAAFSWMMSASPPVNRCASSVSGGIERQKKSS